jgi:hypothetical protein
LRWAANAGFSNPAFFLIKTGPTSEKEAVEKAAAFQTGKIYAISSRSYSVNE